MEGEETASSDIGLLSLNARGGNLQRCAWFAICRYSVRFVEVRTTIFQPLIWHISCMETTSTPYPCIGFQYVPEEISKLIFRHIFDISKSERWRQARTFPCSWPLYNSGCNIFASSSFHSKKIVNAIKKNTETVSHKHTNHLSGTQIVNVRLFGVFQMVLQIFSQSFVQFHKHVQIAIKMKPLDNVAKTHSRNMKVLHKKG